VNRTVLGVELFFGWFGQKCNIHPYFQSLIYKKGAKKIIKMKMMSLYFIERGKTGRETENGKRVKKMEKMRRVKKRENRKSEKRRR
jgi:hypothetical protein